MPMKFGVSDYGTPKIVGLRLDKSGQNTLGMKKVMELIFIDMLVGNEANIRSGGHRGGGSYAELRPNTLKKKGSAEILYTRGSREGYKKLKGDDLLVSSVTQPDAPYQIRRVTRDRVELGTKRPRARVHQYGSSKRNIPARPFLQFTLHDVDRWNGWIAEELMRPFREK